VSSPYALAADQLRVSITVRARLYRNLVVTVTAGSVGAVVGSVVLGSPLPLLAFLALPPVVLAHAARDSAEVHAWRRRVIDDWIDGSTRLDLLRSMLAQVPMLPVSTVQGMLDSLPAWPETVPTGVRPSLATLQDSLGALVRQTLWGRAAAGSLVFASVIVATLAARPVLLGGAVVALAGTLAWRLAARRRLAATVSAAFGEVTARSGPADAAAWLCAANAQGLPRDMLRRWQDEGDKLSLAAARTGKGMAD
jgi:hypothetical protein